MNNVYVRSDKSIKSITLTRLLFLLPLIIYGFYYNGLYLYINKYTDIVGLFKPLIIIFGGGLVGTLVNIIYEKLIKHNKDSIGECIFSSFHFEYGILFGCLVSINVNIYIYFSILLVVLFLSKFIKNRINVVCLMFLILYLIESKMGTFNFLNSYQASKVFKLDFLDYVIGRGFGGIATTNVLLSMIALIGLELTNNNKSKISVSIIFTVSILALIKYVINPYNIGEFLFNYNNAIFLFTFVATSYQTSSYTNTGKIIYGVIIGLISFFLTPVNTVLAPIIAILVASLFNVFFDYKFGHSRSV